MCIVKMYSEQFELWNGVLHSVSGVNLFIMRIYFAHVFGVNEANACLSFKNHHEISFCLQ